MRILAHDKFIRVIQLGRQQFVPKEISSRCCSGLGDTDDDYLDL